MIWLIIVNTPVFLGKGNKSGIHTRKYHPLYSNYWINLFTQSPFLNKIRFCFFISQSPGFLCNTCEPNNLAKNLFFYLCIYFLKSVRPTLTRFTDTIKTTFEMNRNSESIIWVYVLSATIGWALTLFFCTTPFEGGV